MYSMYALFPFNAYLQLIILTSTNFETNTH